jgi:hypothetical protein
MRAIAQPDKTSYQGVLLPGRSYRVLRPFLDCRKGVHRPGETFTYRGRIDSGFGGGTAIFVEGIEDAAFAIPWESDDSDSVSSAPAKYFEEIAKL